MSARAYDALFSQALVYESNGETSEAEACYLRLLELGDSDVRVYLNLGTIRAIERNFEAAATYFLAALRVDSEYARAHFNLACVLEEQGFAQTALSHYKRAVRIDPQYADAYYNLALLYDRLSEPRKALPHWQKYSKLTATQDAYAKHAKLRVNCILVADCLKVVWRNYTPALTIQRAALQVV